MLSPEEFSRWCVEPCKRLVAEVRKHVPGAKIIGFPRGADTLLQAYLKEVPVNGVSLDWSMNRALARTWSGEHVALQGNLEPVVLVAGGAALDQAVDAVLAGFMGAPHIFNLGHGITPDTPIAHVERMLARVRAGGRH